MKQILATLVGLAIITAVGCGPMNGARERQLGHIPPPDGYEEEQMEPIEFEEDADYAADPEPADEGEPEYAEADFEPAAEPEPAEPADEGTYTVQQGDTLWSIAVDVYGDGQRWEDIVEANPEINNPDEIYEGQELILP